MATQRIPRKLQRKFRHDCVKCCLGPVARPAPCFSGDDVATGVRGTEGYADAAEQLVQDWQGLSFAAQHRHNLHLLPAPPADVLDIGAGIGIDAAGFATLGHRVVAAEPVDEFRSAGKALCADPRITWLDDALPDLKVTAALGRRFDVIAAMAVVMHLDGAERRAALTAMARLLKPAGRLVMSLRHGPVPAGRRMFEVCGDEIMSLAQAHGLILLHRLDSQSLQAANRALGVSWTHLAFAVGT